MTDTVRIATAEDEPEIIRLLHLMHAEGGMLPLDEDCARELFHRAFNRKGGIIGVIGDKNNIKAMIYLLITRFWYTKENHLEELFNFVREDYRKKDCAKILINFAKQCADEISIPLVIGVMTNKRTAAKVRLYRKFLNAPSGAFFIYGAKWKNQQEDESQEFWKEILADAGNLKTVPTNSRVIPQELLERMGGGDTTRGRAILDNFLSKMCPQKNGHAKEAQQ